MAILRHLPVPAIGQRTYLSAKKLPAPRAFALTLFLLAGDADGREFIAIAIEPAGQTQTQRAGIELVRLAFAVERNGRDEKTLRSGGDEFPMQHETEAARLLHAEDLNAFTHEFTDMRDEFGAGELAGSERAGVIFLRHGHDELQMHVQAECDARFVGIQRCRGQGLTRRNRSRHNRLVQVGRGDYGLGRHDGFENVFFH